VWRKPRGVIARALPAAQRVSRYRPDAWFVALESFNGHRCGLIVEADVRQRFEGRCADVDASVADPPAQDGP
jgi:hypothetical protein